jgi:DNA-directed RNA polymerase specialized sigma24 family protein
MEPDVIAWPGPRHTGSPATGTPRASSPDEVLAGLFSQHYIALVRLTVVLLRDLAAAEAVVQDAFVAIHRQRLRDPDQALACLRRAVVNGSRSVLRRRAAADRHPPPPPPGAPGAGPGAMVRLEMSAVAAALSTLPRWQCEAVMLRYYADLSETETAAAMGISEGAVRSHAHRGMAALRQWLDFPEAQKTSW